MQLIGRFNDAIFNSMVWKPMVYGSLIHAFDAAFVDYPDYKWKGRALNNQSLLSIAKWPIMVGRTWAVGDNLDLRSKFV